MTLNDVEQAIRNLITNQPMITTGASGEVVNSILSIINSYRNLRFSIQNHPAQDTFKFNALNLSQRFENDISNGICQTLQERGINIMMYMPAGQYGINPNYNMYPNMANGMSQNPNMSNPAMGNGMGSNVNSGVLGGQVVYNNPPMQPNPYQTNSGLQYNQPVQPAQPVYPQQPQFRPNGNGYQRPPRGVNPNMRPQMYPRNPAPTQPISVDGLNMGGAPVQPVPTRPHSSAPIQPRKSEFSMPKPSVQPSKAAVEMNNSKDLTKQKPVPQQKPVSQPKPDVKENIETVQEEQVAPQPKQQEEQPVSMVKATGRDYLLELLKK